MKAFLLLVCYLLVDAIFRWRIVNPVLRDNGIEPYRWIRHAKIKALTDYFYYWKLAPKDAQGLICIFTSVLLQFFMIWVIVELLRTIKSL